HLLGIDSKDYITFGTDMLSDEHDDLVPFRNGDFFTEDYAMVNGVYYDNETGEEIEENDELKEMKEKVEKELSPRTKCYKVTYCAFTNQMTIGNLSIPTTTSMMTNRLIFQTI